MMLVLGESSYSYARLVHGHLMTLVFSSMANPNTLVAGNGFSKCEICLAVYSKVPVSMICSIVL